MRGTNQCMIQSDAQVTFIIIIIPDCKTGALVQVKPDQTGTKPESLLGAVFCFHVITVCLLVCNSTEMASSVAFLLLPL